MMMDDKQLEAMKLAMTLYFMKDAPDNVLMADFRRIYEAGYKDALLSLQDMPAIQKMKADRVTRTS